ncbi:hypothetical protein AMTRI_Chr02g265460 [Amborella trichopoda]
MQNEEGQNMDLYIPRKCSATNRLITSKDHASVQINIGHLDENGLYHGQFTTFALCGFVRAQFNLGTGTSLYFGSFFDIIHFGKMRSSLDSHMGHLYSSKIPILWVIIV